MIFLFRPGTVREKLALIFRATRQHAQNLAKYATIYKSTMLLLKYMGTDPGKEGRYDTFFSGLLGGYLIFGRRSKRGHISSVSKQIVIFGMRTAQWSFCILIGSSLRPRLPLSGKTFHWTFGWNNQRSTTIETNISRRLASLCCIKLGPSHVALQMVPRDCSVGFALIHGLYIRPVRSLGQLEKLSHLQQVITVYGAHDDGLN